jgi:hypothetical protein
MSIVSLCQSSLIYLAFMHRKYTHSPPTFPVFASILRASTVLEFPSFREFAVNYFQTIWSDNLDAVSDERLPFALETIVLARECNVQGPLKRAFYELLRIPEFLDVFGEDSSPAVQQSDLSRRLSSADVRRLHRARDRLVLSWTQAMTSPPPLLTCGDHPLSDNAVWFASVFQSGIFQDYLYDPICGFDEVLLGINWDEALKSSQSCENCNKGRRGTWSKQKVELWKNLDGWLELPDP